MTMNISYLQEWFRHHETIIMWLGLFSVFMFLGFLLAIPILVVRLPADYFVNQTILNHGKSKRISFLRVVYMIFKNTIGVLFILAGIGMLFLPGQGILTLIIGVSLLNIPGKRHLFIAILQQKRMLRSMNRLRARFRKPAFRTHP